MIYQEFAKFYDELFDETMYDGWLSFVKDNVNVNDKMMDMACGTGRLLELLLENNYQVSGMDLSEDMLTLADERIRNNDNNAELIQGDMTDLSDFPSYDAISCFDDSLCYLPDITTLEITFKNVYEHLNEGGKFLFDVITPYQTDEVYPGYMYNFHDDSSAFMWQSYIGEHEHSVEHDLVFFNYNESKDAYDQFSEIHKERTYELDTYLDLLSDIGFKNIKVSSNFGHDDIEEDTTRWFFMCQKG
ncbi:class I SAM-dependent DNA methyltransferase [Apilactobacillus bombintestini]|uniref:Class I SAM-dependent methyltransferase n=1 Tax=Apilactobacillus bombintestini TaxID=2419772 RepID=A0A387ASR9_9LACO|nr:class I SAM-dependent methyltransferase [Apilactobacillus bombintestini]AYF92678.1 class I SAM-dependent methyltransferase [Apilactobacillus bombintestini]